MEPRLIFGFIGVGIAILAVIALAYLMQRRAQSGRPYNSNLLLKLTGGLFLVMGGVKFGSLRGEWDVGGIIDVVLGCLFLAAGFSQIFSLELQAWRNKRKGTTVNPGAQP